MLRSEANLHATHNERQMPEARLEQVITNLVANARDAMPDGGSLTIRTELRDLDRRRPEGGFGELAEGRYLSLAFVDTGMGMPPEVQARIFEPYFTTKGGRGTGLGLSTVFGIVQQAGGAVCVTTVPGLGSTFEVLLPQATQPSELLVLRALAEARAGTETLLLVERDDLVRAAAATILRARGYVVLEAMDGADALQVSATHPGPIELLLADPSATDDGGVDLVHALGRVRPELRTLYLSGPPGPAPSGTSPMAWLPKPFTADTLSHRVRELLDEH
jgi:CheY-like chemotaxis protein